MRRRIPKGLTGIHRSREFGAVGTDDHRTDRHVTRPGGPRRPPARHGSDLRRVAERRSAPVRAHRPRRSITADNCSAKPISRAMRPSCSSAYRSVSSTITLSTASGNPMSDSRPEVAFLERIGILEVFGVDFGVQIVQHLGGDVVVQRRGGIRQQQPGSRRRRTDDDEKLVVHVQQPEDSAGAAQLSQFGLGGRQTGQRLGGHRRTAPAAFFAHNGHAEAVRGIRGRAWRC